MSLDNIVEESYMKRKQGMKIAVLLPDIHVPDQDEMTIRPVLKAIKDINPNVIVQQGDFYDAYSISRFDKDPRRIGRLQEEIDEGRNLWSRIQKMAPKADYVQLEGNHEARLQKYLKKNPELFGLEALNPSVLFGLNDLGIKYVPAGQTYKLNNKFMVSHGAIDDGCKLSQHSGYSAKNTLEKLGMSGSIGHSHRMGASYKTNMNGTNVIYENGCLCKLDPSYMKHPNWQQGFSVVYLTKNRFDVVQVPITDHKFIFNGKVYK